MSKPKKRLGLILFLFTAILSGALAGLYIATPTLAEKALSHWLEQQQYSSIILEMEPPGWDQLEITRITLVKEEEGKHLTVSSHNIHITYNPLDLFFENRLDTVLLPESEVTIRFQQQSSNSDTDEVINFSNLLPSQWLNTLPLNSLRIGQLDLVLDYPEGESDWRFKGALLLENATLYSRVHFTRNLKELGWGDLKLADDDSVQLRLLSRDQPFLEIEGQLQFEEQLSFQSQQILTLNNLSQLANKLNFHEIPDVDGELMFSGTSVFPVTTRLSPDALLKSVKTQQQFSGHLNLGHPLPNLASANVEVLGDLQFSLQELSLNLSPSSKMELSGINHGLLHKEIDQINVNLTKPVSVNSQLTSDEQGAINPSVSPISLLVALTPINTKEVEIGKSNLHVTLDSINPLAQSISGQIKVPHLQLNLPSQKLPTLELSTSFKLEKNNLSQTLSLATAGLPLRLNATSQTDLSDFSSRLDWKIKPISLKNIDRTLSPYFHVPAELAIQQGTFFHNGRTSINAQGRITTTLNNSLRNVDFSWDEIFFKDLNQDSRSRISSNGSIADTGNIKLAKVITGVEIARVESQYVYERKNGRDLVTLEKPQAELLQGLLTFSDFSFAPSKPDFSTEVRITDLDLGDVLALERQQGLAGEGKLDGHFPLQFKADQLTITDGVLSGQPPGGKITFTPSAAVQAYSAANVGLKMAIEALGNFHYDTLEIGLNYLSDGTALLKTRLKGKNPEWNKGHPVDFTINVEENIPKLIKTLQFADKLTNTIEKRYR